MIEPSTAADPWSLVSVCLPTLNEQQNLPRCLASVRGAGELIVVDSGSTDQTRPIAESFGARWFERPWSGFGPQRAFAEQQATRPFILFLDADEWLSPELHAEIARHLESPQAARALLVFRRLSEFLGRPIRHGDWRNDWVARLAPRGVSVWAGDEPHPYLIAPQLRPVRCAAPLHHRPYATVTVFSQKIESYARTWARVAGTRGEQANPLEGPARAAWRLVRGLLLRAGWRDGYPGWLIALQNARMVYLKYRFLREFRAGRLPL